MEKITLTVPASREVSGRALAGVVGSGDMEALFTAEPGQTLTIDITTSVDNSRGRWEALFNRLQTVSSLPAGKLTIHDFGATPGVARIRMVVAKGTINGQPAVVVAIEGTFQGGSMGEVSGAKMAAALELAAEDNRNGIPTQAVLCLETGGVRLQEANLGLAAIADIHAAIVDLRRYTPVVGIVAGTVGCFGGMSIAAALCSYLIVTREARLGLNGPQVIEQEAGIEEYDSRDRPFIWSMTGGERAGGRAGGRRRERGESRDERSHRQRRTGETSHR